MFTIFINEKVIYLTDNLQYSSEKYFFNIDKVDVVSLISELEENTIDILYLYNEDITLLWRKFERNFKTIEAAGGLVKNPKGDTLFIYRNGVWDLPKGKIEKGEKIEEAAIREVAEECGIANLKIEDTLAKTYHIYTFKERCILKITHWFTMSSNFKGILKPQEEEGITKAEWMDKRQVKEALENTYENIKRLF